MGVGDIIIIITVLAIIMLIISTFESWDIRKEYIRYAIKKINRVYKELWTEGDFIVRIVQCGMIFLSEAFNLISIYTVVLKYIRFHWSIEINSFLKALVIGISFLLVHYLMGYILLLSSNLHSFMCTGIDKSIKGDFLLTYFITSSYVMTLIVFPSELRKYVISGVIGIIISYSLNMKLLLKLMRNPRYIKFDKGERSSFIKVFIASMTIVIMIVINLFLGVALANIANEGAFSSNPSYFDLFYYTVVTFTTIGFGDISPVTGIAKFMAIVISLTSIICLTIFLGSIFSLRDRKS